MNNSLYNRRKLPWQTIDNAVISHPTSSINFVLKINLVPDVSHRHFNPNNALFHKSSIKKSQSSDQVL